VTEIRPVVNFDRIVLRAVGELFVEPGEQESLRVEAEKHLMPQLSTEVRDGVLTLDVIGSASTTFPIRYFVTVKTLTGVRSEGSGAVWVQRLNTERFEIAANGSGSVLLARVKADELMVSMRGSAVVKVQEGEVLKQAINVHGAGRYQAEGLSSDNATVVLAGSGDVTISVTKSLAVHLEGSGHVRYLGSPTVIGSVSGSGQITRVEP